MTTRSGNEAALEAFVRWLHYQYVPVPSVGGYCFAVQNLVDFID